MKSRPSGRCYRAPADAGGVSVPEVPRALAALAALVALVSWPLGSDLDPRLDADGAWEIGLRQALHDGLDYGPDVLFTYGPLGFLHVPLLVYPWSARLAFAWWALMHLVLVATLLWALTLGLRSRVLAVILTIPLAVALGGAPDLAVNAVLTSIAAVALIAGLARGRWAPRSRSASGRSRASPSSTSSTPGSRSPRSA